GQRGIRGLCHGGEAGKARIGRRSGRGRRHGLLALLAHRIGERRLAGFRRARQHRKRAAAGGLLLFLPRREAEPLLARPLGRGGAALLPLELRAHGSPRRIRACRERAAATPIRRGSPPAMLSRNAPPGAAAAISLPSPARRPSSASNAW